MLLSSKVADLEGTHRTVALSNTCLLLQNGYNLYKAGTWSEARALLEETYTMRRDHVGRVVRDTPSRVLLDFMAQTQYLAPGDWEGHRELSEK